MPRTAMAAAQQVTPKGPNQGTIAPGDLTLVFANSDNANGMTLSGARKDLLLVKNSHATLARTFSITSSVDERKRTNNVTAYSLAAGEIAVFHFGDLTGWTQSDGTIQLDSSGAEIQFVVLRSQ
jgi:hypothetical protein